MNATTTLSIALACLLAACNDKKPEPSPGATIEELPGVGKVELGDGIGSHGVSLETRIIGDIKQMIADGADPDKPHLIEHHLAAGTLETAKAIVKWGTENGFTPTGFDESKVVAGEWINIDLVKPTKLDPAVLWQDSSQLSVLAESLECEYDHWGCKELVK